MQKTYNLLISFALICLIASCATKAQRTWVFDNESVLDSTQIKQLHNLFNSHEIKTTNEIALITTPNYGYDTSILFFAVNNFRRLGLGKKGINNGVLIVYCGAKREARIENGYGTERILKDEMATRIIDSIMIPHFKKGETFEGLWQGSKAIVDFLERPENKIK
jgi:uncharacterized protein